MAKRSHTASTRQDTAWKDILDNYFKDCLDFCLPEVSALVDWQ